MKQSSQPDIKALTLPRDENVRAVKVDLADENGVSHPHILVMKRLKKFSAYGGEDVAESWWTLVFAVPEEEIYQALTETRASLESTVRTTLSSQVAVAVVTLIAVFLGVWLVARHMTAGLIALAGAAGKLSGKDYSVRVDVKANDEIGQLGVAFNSMAGEIEQYTQNLENLVDERTRELSDAKARIEDLNKQLRAENLRLGAEMQVAQRLQLMVLPKPKELAEVTNLDIAGYMKPADEVGGDYYDVLHTDDIVKIGIGDVTGHGLESGVLMLMVQSITRTLLDSGSYTPERFLGLLNQVLFKNIIRIDSERNLTLLFADYKDHALTIYGQHEEVIIVRASGELERIDTMDLGFPVGLVDQIEDFVVPKTIPFEKDDIAVFYTDGVTEADNESDAQYGMDALCQTVLDHRGEDAEHISGEIIRSLTSHIGGQTIYDDITLVVVKAK